MAESAVLSSGDRLLEVLDSGRFDPETVRWVGLEGGALIARAVPAYARGEVLLRLVDFFCDPCPETAKALRDPIALRAQKAEERLIREGASANLLPRLERWFGYDASELTEICQVTRETLKRWQRAGHCGSKQSFLEDIAVIAGWLEAAGLTEDEARQWFESSHPELPGGVSPRTYVEKGSAFERAKAIDLARDLCHERRPRRWSSPR